MNRADLTAELMKLPPHSRGRRPIEQIIHKMTTDELKWDRIEWELVERLSAAMDSEFGASK